MKIQLGKTAKMFSGILLKSWSHAHDGGGVTVNLLQRVERDTTHVGTRRVIRKDVTIELKLDEAEKLGHELLEGVREERRRQYRAKRGALPLVDHKCHHCGHEWRGLFDDRCPRVHDAPHPAYPHGLTREELTMLMDAQAWITGHESWDRVRTDAYDRNVLNALVERGLIEFCDEDKATWRPNSVGRFIVEEAKAGRTSVINGPEGR